MKYMTLNVRVPVPPSDSEDDVRRKAMSALESSLGVVEWRRDDMDYRHPDCPGCNRRVLPRWDVHDVAKKIAAGESNLCTAAEEIGITRQAIDQALRKHGLHDCIYQGRAVRGAKVIEAQALKARQAADRPRIYTKQNPDSIISKEFMLASLQAMYRLLEPSLAGRPMTREQYEEARPPELPSGSTILDQLDTWNKACDLAGVPHNPPARNNYTRLPKSKALSDVIRYIIFYREQSGRYAGITAANYDFWASNADNQAVSRSHISKRYGWSALLGEALEVLYGGEDEGEDDDVAAER